MLAPGMFADDVALGPDEMVVGAALDPGEAPLSGLQVGAPVELLALEPVAAAADDGACRRGAGRSAVTSLGTGTVWAVEPSPPASCGCRCGSTGDVGLAASQAAAADTLRVVLVGAAG